MIREAGSLFTLGVPNPRPHVHETLSLGGGVAAIVETRVTPRWRAADNMSMRHGSDRITEIAAPVRLSPFKRPSRRWRSTLSRAVWVCVCVCATARDPREPGCERRFLFVRSDSFGRFNNAWGGIRRGKGHTGWLAGLPASIVPACACACVSVCL